MKLLATGDLHLGASPDLGAHPGDRLRDQQSIWLKIARLAITEKVDGVLFAGDAFHRRRPTPSELMVWRGGLEMLGDEGIGVLAIAGNHDVEHADAPAAFEVVRGASFSYYDPIRRPGISYAFEGAAVACLPWTPPARLIASRGGGDRDELNSDVAELLVQTAAELRSEIPADKAAILLGHWSVSGAALPTGLPTDVLREPVLPLSALEELKFDAVVMGHIHRGQVMSPGPLAVDGNGSHRVEPRAPIIYVGSPATVDWGETAFEHGAWLLEPEDGVLTYTFLPLEDRRFLTLDIDLTTETTPAAPGLDDTDCLTAFIAEHLPLTDALVRLRYKATAEQARHLDLDAIRGFCRDAGVAKLVLRPEILRTDRVRVEGVDESLTELEALQRWSDVHDVDPLQRERLANLTTTYLEAA